MEQVASKRECLNLAYDCKVMLDKHAFPITDNQLKQLSEDVGPILAMIRRKVDAGDITHIFNVDRLQSRIEAVVGELNIKEIILVTDDGTVKIR